MDVWQKMFSGELKGIEMLKEIAVFIIMVFLFRRARYCGTCAFGSIYRGFFSLSLCL